jgi:two-component system, LytTR family, response regulator LytT
MRILIVEDERVAARGLQRMVQNLSAKEGKDIGWIGWEATLDAARAALTENPVDILFLDLNLNGESGFDLLHEAVAGSFHTIVVSANENQALRAFEYGVLDFVPKPVSEERLAKAMHRVWYGNERQGNESGTHAKYLPIRKPKGIALVSLEDVSYFQGDGNYVEIRLKSGAAEYHRQTLDSLGKVLPARFSRIHRSIIVDMKDVKQVISHGGGRYEAELQSGTTLPLSRAYHKNFKHVNFD